VPAIARHEIAAPQHAFTATTRHGDLDAGIVAGQTHQVGAATNPHSPRTQVVLQHFLELVLREEDTVGVAGTPWARVQRHRQASKVPASRLPPDSTLVRRIEQAAHR
jgi:hypothetical protein